MANVAERIQRLTHRLLMERAKKLWAEIQTPVDSVEPLVVQQARDAEALVNKPEERNTVVSARCNGLRVSFHFYNSDQDVQLLAYEQEPRPACP